MFIFTQDLLVSPKCDIVSKILQGILQFKHRHLHDSIYKTRVNIH